ncbi:phosphomannomutase/phosphoglucomutase [Candidatus Woesearchaeota archaeon]|nr:phosphomannomutase/phosphoglucomutase [Candidatus Woesearchaeota archaeon]
MSDPFKAYDIRGVYQRDIDEEFALNLGKAIGTYLKGEKIVVARDGRKSGDKLYPALIKGILSTGKNVVTIGKVSTPQFYFSLYSGTACGGVIITASHNPKEYNGFKICSENAVPIFKENGLEEIKQIMNKKEFNKKTPGHLIQKTINEEYVNEIKKLTKPIHRSYKILADTGNGMGILEVKALKKIFGEKIHLEVMFAEIDGTFPNHECNPAINANLKQIVAKIKKEEFDFGVAFDGDADRVIFVTNEGDIIPADIMIGIIGSNILKEGERAGYEVRSSRAVKEILEENKIESFLFASGAPYIKKGMKKNSVQFAGEKSGHYVYQKLHYTDSSIYTIINVLNILDKTNKTLKELSSPLIEKYANSGEINYEVNDPNYALKEIKKEFTNEAKEILEIDGISVYSDEYFFNVRKSNTEPLVRVNIEGNRENIVKELKEKIEHIISRA